MTAVAGAAAELSPEQALAVIEPYFVVLRDDYFIEHGLAAVSRTAIYCAPWVHDSERHFAACREDGLAVIAAPEMAELPYGTMSAILAHELGHAVDYLYPGEFALGRDQTALRRRREDFTDAQWARWMRCWEDRSDDVIEYTADAIAELVTGARIGYSGPCKLQAFSRGQARPQGLR